MIYNDFLELAKQSGVIIHYNNEIGIWQYSVVVNMDYWLGSFKTKEFAESFCRVNNLTINKFISDKPDE